MKKLFEFEYDGSLYWVKEERKRMFHGDKANTMYYGMKDGEYVRGTSSMNLEYSLNLLTADMDSSKIMWKNSI